MAYKRIENHFLYELPPAARTVLARELEDMEPGSSISMHPVRRIAADEFYGLAPTEAALLDAFEDKENHDLKSFPVIGRTGAWFLNPIRGFEESPAGYLRLINFIQKGKNVWTVHIAPRRYTRYASLAQFQ